MIRLFLLFLSYLAYGYIVFYGSITFLLDPSVITLKFKIVTTILLGVSVLVLIIERILDTKEKRIKEKKGSFDRQEIKRGINILLNPQREKLITGEKNNRHKMMQEDDIGNNFVSLYFEQIEKISCCLTQRDWENSEFEIYISIVNRINKYYNLGDKYSENIRDEKLKLLKKAREKLLKDKRRELESI